MIKRVGDSIGLMNTPQMRSSKAPDGKPIATLPVQTSQRKNQGGVAGGANVAAAATTSTTATGGAGGGGVKRDGS